MNISDKTFYKIVTFITLLFFMIMYTLSFILRRNLDIIGMVGFIMPIVTHIVGSKISEPSTDNTTTGPTT